MAGKTSLKELFSKPRVQWTVVIVLILLFLVIIVSAVSRLNASKSVPPTIVIPQQSPTPNETVASILTGTAYATSHASFPATWTVTPTSTYIPTSTSTATPLNTNTPTVTRTLSASLTPTRSSTPTRTKTPLRTSTPYRTYTKTPTASITPTKTGKLTISMLPASQTIVSGGTASFTITVTNSGTVALTSVVTNDAAAPNCSKSIGSLAVGASNSYTCTRSGVATTFANFITVMGRNPANQDIWANATATVTVTTSSPHITLSKTVYPTTFASLGQVLSYVFVATNDGNVALTNVTVSDPKVASIVCVPPQPATLAVAATLTCSGTHTVTQADLDAGTISDTATTSGTPPSGPAVSGTVSNTATSTATAGITITKLPASQSINYDATVTFTITVTNTGAITLTGVNVTDALASNCNRPALGTLAPGANTSYTCTKTNVTSTFTNVAIASGTPAVGPVVSNSASALVTVVYNPHISLTKNVSLALYSTVGQVLNYTITATNDGNVNLTAVSITDPTLGALTCAQPVTLAPAATLVCTASHTITQTDIDNGSYANTASVSGTPPAGGSASNTASRTANAMQIAAISLDKVISAGDPYDTIGATIDYTLTATNTGNVTLHSVSITDAKLGTLSCTPTQPATLAPGAALVCTGSHTVDANDLAYGAVYNLASVSGLPPSGPAVTKDATTTAYTSTTPDRLAASIDVDADGEHEIVSMDTSGGSQQVIDRTGTDMILGGWAPSEDWLVYDTNTTGQIYMIRPDGSENTLVANLPAGTNSQPAWSPDGNWLVFVNKNGGQTDLYMIHPDGTTPTRLTNDTVIESDPSWLTASKVLFVGDSGVAGNNEIYTLVTSPLGTPAQLVTFANPGLNASPHVSPNGMSIIFARNDSVTPGWDIWIAGSDGSSPTLYAAISYANADQQPSWSRTGTDVLFVSDSLAPGTFQMYIGDGSLVMIVDGYSNEIYPHWMP